MRSSACGLAARAAFTSSSNECVRVAFARNGSNSEGISENTFQFLKSVPNPYITNETTTSANERRTYVQTVGQYPAC